MMHDHTTDAPLQLSPEAQWRAWVKRYTWHIDQVPGLLEAIRASVVPLASTRYDGMRVSSSREGVPMPFRVDAVDDADALWAALVQYTLNVAELLDVPGPGGLMLTWRSRDEAAGIPSRASQRDVRIAAFEVIAWLVQRVEAIAPLEALEGTEDFLFTHIRSLRARYTSAPKPRPEGFCHVCGETAVVSEWTGDGSTLVSRCTACGDVESTVRAPGRSQGCVDDHHDACESLLCACLCHERRVSLFTARIPVEPTTEGLWRLAPFSDRCVHRAWSPYVGVDELRHCGGCGIVL